MSETTPLVPIRPMHLKWWMVYRPHQWLKNLLVFVPVVTAHRMDVATLLHALLAFMAFNFAASAGYIYNDMLDVENDRQHESKKLRPFASGAVALPMAMPLVLSSLAIGAAFSTFLPWMFFLVLAAYFLLSVLYSLRLKRVMMIDVLTLALLYGLRLAGGSAATDVMLSPWLLCFSTFLFFALALVKRVAELRRRLGNGSGDPPGRDYQLVDVAMLEMMAVAAGYVAALTLGLYVSSPAVADLYAHPERLWAMPAVFLFWISRVFMLTHRGVMHDDPVLFAVRDRPSLLCGATLLLVMLSGL